MRLKAPFEVALRCMVKIVRSVFNWKAADSRRASCFGALRVRHNKPSATGSGTLQPVWGAFE